MDNKDNKRTEYLVFFLIISMCMAILNYIMSITVKSVEQNPATKEEETIVAETEQDDKDKHRVYNDLDIDDKTNKLRISTDETHFIYKCFYDTDIVDFVSKVDNSEIYSLIDIYKDGSYTYIIFKTSVDKSELTNANIE